MDRMLGNQYFMARKFSSAIPHFEAALKRHSEDWRIARSLIVCYVAEHKLTKAIGILKTIMGTHTECDLEWQRQESCPCRGILIDWIRTPPPQMPSPDYLLSLAILALFCEPDFSQTCLTRARAQGTDVEWFEDILNAIHKKTDSGQSKDRSSYFPSDNIRKKKKRSTKDEKSNGHPDRHSSDGWIS